MVTFNKIICVSFLDKGRKPFGSGRIFILLKILFIFFETTPAFAQTPSIPVPFDHSWQTFMLSNPSSINAQNSKAFTAGTRFYTGALSVFRSFYATGEFRVGQEIKGSNLGIILTNTREGDLFQQSEVQLVYAYRLMLKENLAFAGGASFGFRNYFTEPTSISPGSSDFIPTANIGIWLSSDIWQTGISFNQVPGESFVPLQERIKLSRYFTFSGERAWQLGHKINFITAGLLILPMEARIRFNVSGIFEFNKLVNCGLSYRYKEAVSVIAGLNKIDLSGGKEEKKSKAGFYLSYSFPAGVDYKGLHIVELSLRYFVL